MLQTCGIWVDMMCVAYVICVACKRFGVYAVSGLWTPELFSIAAEALQRVCHEGRSLRDLLGCKVKMRQRAEGENMSYFRSWLGSSCRNCIIC